MDTKKITVMQKLLKANDAVAAGLRRELKEKNIFFVNLMSSPGSGKTTLVEETVRRLGKRIKVIEGDIQTTLDAERLQKLGIQAYQINTGPFGGDCHLEASWIQAAVAELGTNGMDYLFVENIGNLVCPAEFDVGAHMNVLLISVTEGEDKPLKYPLAFQVSQLCLVTKTDFLPLKNFSLAALRGNIKKVNPACAVVEVSAHSGAGMESWIEILRNKPNFQC
ncbi:MAG: hydrogenase nickel incorporation protein HypB [Acidobacteria bacterium]|jgi:hydrogenase nickel incorporation protein HypB|nr:hydrogenase nickel incorporation protein HypB [Acidobacteriota bacterium]